MRISLSDSIRQLKKGIDDLSHIDYPKISIQERSLTIKGKHYIYETGLMKPVNFGDESWKPLSTQSIEHTGLQLHITENKSNETGLLKFGLMLIE